jgi:hypothetical protein
VPVRQLWEPLRRQVQLPWNSLAVAAGAGLLVVVVLWLTGPGLFGDGAAPQGTVVRAKVISSMDCTKPNAEEAVTFPLGGTTREGTLNGCGHDKGEELDVMVPAAPGPGTITVETSKVVNGSSSARRPLGLFLITLSCVAGAAYTHLVLRPMPTKPKSKPTPPAAPASTPPSPAEA